MRGTIGAGCAGVCVRAGELGEIRKVAVEYLQGWLSKPLEARGRSRRRGGSDPELNGPGGCIGDIGTHAFHLTGVCDGAEGDGMHAALRRVVPGRRVDDDCKALLRLEGGAPGALMASQVAAGEGNGLRLRVYGEKGRCDWKQEEPNRLRVKWQDGPEEIWHAAAGYLSAARWR